MDVMKQYFYFRINVKINISYVKVVVKCIACVEMLESSELEEWLSALLIAYNIKEWYYEGKSTANDYRESQLKFDLTR